MKRVPTAAMLAALLCCAEARGVTQWEGRPYSVTAVGSIQGVGQACTGSTAMALSHDGACMISVSVGQLGDEVLTLGGPGGPTLTTSYMITGACLSNPDADWVSSTPFLVRTYSVQGSGVSDPLTLSVRGQAPSNSAPDPGNYTATIVLTVTF